MQTPSSPQSTARDWSQCLCCGATDQPMIAKDFHFARRAGSAWVLAAVCRDIHGCSQRRQARDARLDERYSLTAAGYAAVEAMDPTIHATSKPGAYVADSQTVPGVKYALTVESDGRATCSCKGHGYRGICKHSRQLERILAGRSVLRGAA